MNKNIIKISLSIWCALLFRVNLAMDEGAQQERYKKDRNIFLRTHYLLNGTESEEKKEEIFNNLPTYNAETIFFRRSKKHCLVGTGLLISGLLCIGLSAQELSENGSQQMCAENDLLRYLAIEAGMFTTVAGGVFCGLMCHNYESGKECLKRLHKWKQINDLKVKTE